MIRIGAISTGVLAGLTVGCVYPTERSDQLTVELDPIPIYRQGEIDTLSGRVVTAGGGVVPDVEIRFQSSNPNALTVTVGGAVQATGAGIAVVTARALGFENATPAEQIVTVKSPVAVDSVRPVLAQYGRTVQFHGAGLNPDSLILVEMGGVEVPQYFAWTPADPDKPNGLGVLDVWVAPPTPPRADIRVAGVGGGATAADSLRVARFDIYEPNDSMPSNLGALPLGFFNPALAFEQRLREQLGADWYGFEQTSVSDRTVAVISSQVNTQAFRVILTQPGVFSRTAEGRIEVTGPGWAIGGPGLQVCGGVPFEFEVLPGGVVINAYRGLPVGSYEILMPYGAVAGYELFVINEYFAIVPPDRDEENDSCVLAKPLVAGESKQLTIDNPYDTDWFRYRPDANVVAVFSTALTGEIVPGFLDPELDIFVFQETASGITPIVESTASDNATDIAAVSLQAGQSYLILVADYAGVPTRYVLTLTTTPAPAATDFVSPSPLTKIRPGLKAVANRSSVPVSTPLRSYLRRAVRP